MYVNGSGFRAIERVKVVHHTTVITWVKLELLAQAGCVKEGSQTQERIQQVAADYLALATEEREPTLVLAGTNTERLALTQAMRSGLQDEGALGADGFVMQSLRRKDLTTA